MVLGYYRPIVLLDCIETLRHFLHAGRGRETLSYMEEPMAAVDFIITLYLLYLST
jgi:hypothetical protein